MGAIVVASAVGGLREVVGVVRILVPPGDPQALAKAMTKALSAPDKTAAVRRARLIHQQATRGLLDTYSQCLANRSRQAES